jgi:hypothetical protein
MVKAAVDQSVLFITIIRLRALDSALHEEEEEIYICSSRLGLIKMDHHHSGNHEISRGTRLHESTSLGVMVWEEVRRKSLRVITQLDSLKPSQFFAVGLPATEAVDSIVQYHGYT